MIFFSNHSRIGEDEPLAKKMRRLAEVNNTEKLFNIKERFKREVKIASRQGDHKLDFIIIDKDGSIFLNDELINKFKEFIINNGFELEYKFVDEPEIMDKFHLFSVNW